MSLTRLPVDGLSLVAIAQNIAAISTGWSLDTLAPKSRALLSDEIDALLVYINAFPCCDDNAVEMLDVVANDGQSITCFFKQASGKLCTYTMSVRSMSDPLANSCTEHEFMRSICHQFERVDFGFEKDRAWPHQLITDAVIRPVALFDHVGTGNHSTLFQYDTDGTVGMDYLEFVDMVVSNGCDVEFIVDETGYSYFRVTHPSTLH